MSERPARRVPDAAPPIPDTIAARQAVIGDCLDWIECARRLHAAGFRDAAISIALAEET